MRISWRGRASDGFSTAESCVRVEFEVVKATHVEDPLRRSFFCDTIKRKDEFEMDLCVLFCHIEVTNSHPC